MIEQAYSFGFIDILKVFLRHITRVIVALRNMCANNDSTYVATMMVAKAREMWSVGQSPWRTIAGHQAATTKEASWRKVLSLSGKASGVK